MTIDEAIEILGDFVVESEDEEDIKGNEALNMGIEALQRINRGRIDGVYVSPGLLPGETTE